MTSQGSDDTMVRKANPLKSWFPFIVIAGALVLSFTVYYTLYADPENFEGGLEAVEALKTWTPESGTDAPIPTKGNPLNFFGIVYKGGFIISIGQALLIISVIFGIERFIALFLMAGGKGSADVFAQKIRMNLKNNDIDGAIAECDRQRGSVANVVRSGLVRYKDVVKDPKMDHEQKKVAIQQELEESTSLELPSLEKNLPIIATAVSLGVLVGLLGTVIGMIKAFQALASSGTPDAAELSAGISEALVNTAFGIMTSSISLVFYNFFTSKIDGLTYAIDETGYSIIQTFEKTN